jgi:hypothetical protein
MPDGSALRVAVLALSLAFAGGSASGSGAVELRPREKPWIATERIGEATRAPGQRFALRDGARLGEVALREGWTDFRGQVIPAGRYALRYALQPRLKEHAGADAIRDFALLVPVADDGSTPLLEASRLVSGTHHPAVMALVAWQGEGQAPPEVREETPERLILFRDIGGWTIGFVVIGRAPAPEL